MPSRFVHEYASRLIFHDPYSELHADIDCASVQLGRHHRHVFHNRWWALWWSRKHGDPQAYHAAVLHIKMDEALGNGEELEKLIRSGRYREANRLVLQVHRSGRTTRVKPLRDQDVYAQIRRDGELLDEIKRLSRVLGGEAYKEDAEDYYEFCRFMIQLSDDPAEKAEWIRKLEKIRIIDEIMGYQ